MIRRVRGRNLAMVRVVSKRRPAPLSAQPPR